MDVVKQLRKLLRKRQISGYVYTHDGRIKVFVPPGYTERIRTMVSSADIEEGVFTLMGETQPVSEPYARAWCISNCRCSPPIGGFTCHHCASPDNKDYTGYVGYLFKVPYNMEIDSEVKIVKDYPFVQYGLTSMLMAMFCRIFSLPDICRRQQFGVNKFDFAKLDYNETPPDLGRYSAVIFAGIDKGPYAVAYPFENIPDTFKPDNIVHPSVASQLAAYVVHCDTWGGSRRCPTIRRTYRYYGSGVVNVYAYGKYYTFADVVFLTATDLPLVIDCCNERKVVTWAIQPGYSGSVVYEPAQ